MQVRIVANLKTVCLFLLFTLFLAGATAAEQDGAGREELLERQKELQSRIAALQREQDFLLFQKAMFVSDSKYLLIDVKNKNGQLKYKNRILKDFNFASAVRVGALKQGPLTLTEKIEDDRGRHALLFGKSLLLMGKRAPSVRLEAGIPRIFLTKRDFRAIFYALETGAKAYVMP